MIDKIIDLMQERGLTQGQLEDRACLGRARLSKWKRGVGRISADQLGEIARVLGVTAESLRADSPGTIRVDEKLNDERYLIQLIRDLGLTRDEAARRLSGQRIKSPSAIPEAPQVRRTDIRPKGAKPRKRKGGKGPA